MCSICQFKRGNYKKQPLLENRRGIIFHHNNAMPCCHVNQQKLEFSWEVLIQPLYSSDHYIVRLLSFSITTKFPKRKKFENINEVKNYLKPFQSKPPKFFKNDIMKLPTSIRKDYKFKRELFY